MSTLTVGLRLVHIVCGVYWAGTIFFFVTFLDPTVRSLGPDGGKVMVRLFERGYLTVVPVVAGLTVASGGWLLWLTSAGFDSTWMGSAYGIVLSTGGLLATLAFVVGIAVMRPSALRIWAIARELPGLTDAAATGERMAEMQRMRVRAGIAGRIVFVLLAGAVALMAVGRYL